MADTSSWELAWRSAVICLWCASIGAGWWLANRLYAWGRAWAIGWLERRRQRHACVWVHDATGCPLGSLCPDRHRLSDYQQAVGGTIRK